jgi:hypothetical protein
MKTKLIITFLALILQAVAAEPIRFVAIDIFIDPKGEPLAAYQMDIKLADGAKIVGIEGGEHPEFRKAPFYDPKAIQSQRIIVAALSTSPSDKLPTGKTRLLTLHVQCQGPLKFHPVSGIGARPDSSQIKSEITLAERKEP